MARHRFFYLLSLARHRVHKLSDRLVRQELGISGPQLGALFVVAARPGLRQRELAEELGYNDSAITALTRRMIEAELLERRADPDDGRAATLFPSTRGQQVAKRAMPLLARLNGLLMDGFSEAELDIAARFLSTAIERFSDEKEKG